MALRLVNYRKTAPDSDKFRADGEKPCAANYLRFVIHTFFQGTQTKSQGNPINTSEKESHARPDNDIKHAERGVTDHQNGKNNER
ncbi:hypothetical protein [Spirosoma terrae]